MKFLELRKETVDYILVVICMSIQSVSGSGSRNFVSLSYHPAMTCIYRLRSGNNRYGISQYGTLIVVWEDTVESQLWDNNWALTLACMVSFEGGLYILSYW